jgi:hypothetical protein
LLRQAIFSKGCEGLKSQIMETGKELEDWFAYLDWYEHMLKRERMDWGDCVG